MSKKCDFCKTPCGYSWCPAIQEENMVDKPLPFHLWKVQNKNGSLSEWQSLNIDHLKERISELEEALKRKSNSGEQYREQTVEVWEENKELKGRVANLESLLKLAEQDMDEFIKQSEELEEKLKWAQKNYSDSVADCMEYRKQNRGLKARIAELEYELGRSCDFCEKAEKRLKQHNFILQGRDETIATLREALERIANQDTAIVISNGIDHKYNSYQEGWYGIQKFAETALKEAFGDDHDDK